MPSDGKKGITVKIDADLHAEVRQYLESHGMTMAEFVTLALDDELHPKINQKEGQNMGNMRTLAFQVPENLFQRIKEYLQRNNMTQKELVIGLIENELERDQSERENAEQIPEESEKDAGQDENTAVSDFETVSEEAEDCVEEQAENDFSGGFNAVSDESESNDESENVGFSMGM